MEKLQFFEGPNIGATVSLAREQGRQWSLGEELKIDENGILNVAEDIRPQGFYLTLYSPTQSRIVITQRNLTRHHGDYRNPRFESFENVLGDNWIMFSFELPIPVEHQGEKVWTAWKGRPSWKKPTGMPGNKVDCWIIGEGGHIDLFQVGVVTHDDGQTWHLLGEYRWKGKLFRSNGSVVGKPQKPVFGAFGVRKEILEHPEFLDNLRKMKLAPWKGTDEQLNPPLDPITEFGSARVQWYTPFGGQTGQGQAKLHDGSSAWIHGVDIMSSPDPDGIQRLRINNLINYAGTATFGEKQLKDEKPLKLLCVEKVQQT